jgi:hemerythrin-like domain-containing protein
MPYEKKKVRPFIRTAGGKETIGSLLHQFHGETLERIMDHFNRHPVPEENELRERLLEVLNEEIKPVEAYKLGLEHENIKRRLSEYLYLLEEASKGKERPISGVMKEIVEYIEFLRRKTKKRS